MEKLREIQKRLKKNKGFSLVELIIVIAIMAILVAILAPQFLKYVERSRNSADIANAREMTNAIMAYVADPEIESTNQIATGTTIITITGNADGTASGADATHVKDALAQAGISLEKTKCRSKTAWTKYEISVIVDGTTGTVSFTYKADKDGTENSKFAEAFSVSGNSTTTTTPTTGP